MPSTRKLSLFLALLSCGVGAWFWLNAPGETAAWLKVEGPRIAVVGQPFVLRITTNSATPAGVLSADLHWSTTRHENRRFLSQGIAQPVEARGATLIFPVAVPTREDLGYVRAVVYIGPTSRWQERIEAATSEFISVVSVAAAARGGAESREIAMFDQRPDPAPFRQDSRFAQALIATFWAAAALWWWERRKTPPGLGDGDGAATQNWRVPASFCFGAAVWEALPLEGIIGEWARAFAINHRWYDERVGFQVVITSLIIVAAFGLIAAMWARNRNGASRCVWLGLGCYAGVSLASLVSLHKVDAVLAATIRGISVLQWVQVAAAMLAVGGSVGAKTAARWNWRTFT